MEKKLFKKYVAIKPKGLSYYLWFLSENVLQSHGCFIGQSGWGKDGIAVDIKCGLQEIDSFIDSDALQY